MRECTAIAATRTHNARGHIRCNALSVLNSCLAGEDGRTDGRTDGRRKNRGRLVPEQSREKTITLLRSRRRRRRRHRQTVCVCVCVCVCVRGPYISARCHGDALSVRRDGSP